MSEEKKSFCKGGKFGFFVRREVGKTERNGKIGKEESEATAVSG